MKRIFLSYSSNLLTHIHVITADNNSKPISFEEPVYVTIKRGKCYIHILCTRSSLSLCSVGYPMLTSSSHKHKNTHLSCLYFVCIILISQPTSSPTSPSQSPSKSPSMSPTSSPTSKVSCFCCSSILSLDFLRIA